MKVLLICMECSQESSLLDLQPVTVAMNDERFFEMTCSKGHRSLTIIQQPKHEVLFELGMNALVDGYPREAVTSFASCLENFYEFCIKHVSLYKGVDKACFEAGWKPMAKQSERQLGAFIMLWLNYFGSAPSLLKSNSKELRNKVVHKGCIPEIKQAINFGDDVVTCISSNLKDMYDHFSGELDNFFTQEFLARAFSRKQQATTQSIPTTINWAKLVKNKENLDLSARMREIEKDRITFKWPKT